MYVVCAPRTAGVGAPSAPHRAGAPGSLRCALPLRCARWPPEARPLCSNLALPASSQAVTDYMRSRSQAVSSLKAAQQPVTSPRGRGTRSKMGSPTDRADERNRAPQEARHLGAARRVGDAEQLGGLRDGVQQRDTPGQRVLGGGVGGSQGQG